MLVHDHRPGDGQALPRSPTDLFGREERIIDVVPYLTWNPGPRIAHADQHGITIPARSHGDGSPLAAVLDHVSNGVGGIDDDVQKNLGEFILESVSYRVMLIDSFNGNAVGLQPFPDQ